MGSPVRFESELVLRRGDGFPPDLVVGAEHAFTVPGRCLFNLLPNRVFLVEEHGGTPRRVGHAMVTSLTIDPVADRTSGRFVVHVVYPDGYAALADVNEAVG